MAVRFYKKSKRDVVQFSTPLPSMSLFYWSFEDAPLPIITMSVESVFVDNGGSPSSFGEPSFYVYENSIVDTYTIRGEAPISQDSIVEKVLKNPENPLFTDKDGGIRISTEK